MKLNPGEVICPKCKGYRYKKHHELNEIEKFLNQFGKCSTCKGEGKLDWIENVVGKKCTMMKPGVYIREVDHSLMIDPKGEIEWEII